MSSYLITRQLSLCLRLEAVPHPCLPLHSHRLCRWLSRWPRGNLLSLGLSESCWLLVLLWLWLWLYNTNLDTWRLLLRGWGWGWFVLLLLLICRSNLNKKESTYYLLRYSYGVFGKSKNESGSRDSPVVRARLSPLSPRFDAGPVPYGGLVCC